LGSFLFADQAAAAKAKQDFVAELKSKNACGSEGSYSTPRQDPDIDSSSRGNIYLPWVIKKLASGKWVDNPTPPDNINACCPAHADLCQKYDGTDKSPNDVQRKKCRADSCSRPTAADTSTRADCISGGGTYEDWDAWKLSCCDACYPIVSDHPYIPSHYRHGEWQEVVDPNNCREDHTPGLKDKMAKLGGVTDWNDAIKKSTYPEKYPAAWAQLMQEYSRSKTLEICEITREEAVAMFKLYYEKTYLCQYAKANSPFGCEASIQLPISQCFSLAYANSLLMYTVFSTICVKIFFAAKKEPEEDQTSRAQVGP